MNWFDPNVITWYWFIAGILIMLLELLIPGIVIIFFGLGAIVVAIGRWIGLYDSLISSFAVWIISSLMFVILLRKFIRKLFPADEKYQHIKEDLDACGSVVDVVETVNDENDNGRIRFQGTTWPAISEEGIIEAGKKAKLIARDNLAWIVESFEDFDE